MLYIYICVCVCVNIHAYTHTYIYMHHIVFASHAWHLHHCISLRIFVLSVDGAGSWTADLCRSPHSVFSLNMAIILDGHDPGAFRHTHIDSWLERCCTVTCGAFLTWWESWQKVDDSRKPSKTAAAWSFRRAFHSAPKSFLTFWIVVPFIYAQAGTHATLTSSRGGKSIGPSTVVCQTRNLNQGQSSCQEAEGQGQKILGMPIRNHVSPTGGMRNRYSVIANWIEPFGSRFVWWETWGMLSFWRSQKAFRVTFCQGWIWCKRKNGLVALHSSSIIGLTNMWICSPPLV